MATNNHITEAPMRKKDELSKKLAKGLEEMKEGRAELDAKFSPTELRVACNSSKLNRAEEAIKEAEIGVDMLLNAWEDICALNEYLDSGWTTQWWSKRRITITTDEGETQKVEEKEVTIVDE